MFRSVRLRSIAHLPGRAPPQRCTRRTLKGLQILARIICLHCYLVRD